MVIIFVVVSITAIVDNGMGSIDIDTVINFNSTIIIKSTHSITYNTITFIMVVCVP